MFGASEDVSAGYRSQRGAPMSNVLIPCSMALIAAGQRRVPEVPSFHQSTPDRLDCIPCTPKLLPIFLFSDRGKN